MLFESLVAKASNFVDFFLNKRSGVEVTKPKGTLSSSLYPYLFLTQSIQTSQTNNFSIKISSLSNILLL